MSPGCTPAASMPIKYGEFGSQVIGPDAAQLWLDNAFPAGRLKYDFVSCRSLAAHGNVKQQAVLSKLSENDIPKDYVIELL